MNNPNGPPNDQGVDDGNPGAENAPINPASMAGQEGGGGSTTNPVWGNPTRPNQPNRFVKMRARQPEMHMVWQPNGSGSATGSYNADSIEQTHEQPSQEVDGSLIEQNPDWVDANDPRSVADLQIYLAKRPLQDISGSIHDPNNGRFEIPVDFALTKSDLRKLTTTLKDQNQITRLSFAGHEEITDETLYILQDLKQLKVLDLQGTKVKGKGLKHLKDSMDLEVLDLTDTPFESENAVYVAGFKNLKTLRLGNSRITDRGLEAFAPLTQLRELNLKKTAVTGEGFAHLGNLKLLNTLDLSQTEVSNSDIHHLRSLTGLETLYLDNTRIENSGLERLRGLPRLELLSIMCTHVTEEGSQPFLYNRHLQIINVCDQ